MDRVIYSIVYRHNLCHIKNHNFWQIFKIFPVSRRLVRTVSGSCVQPAPIISEFVINMPVMVRNACCCENKTLKFAVFPMRFTVDKTFLDQKFANYSILNIYFSWVRYWNFFSTCRVSLRLKFLNGFNPTVTARAFETTIVICTLFCKSLKLIKFEWTEFYKGIIILC